ncbi:MAG: hypothetical protein AXA67_12190 [Methylothermaceae bacteria B42]|nr:MAG: hypothetical protein AXA67_12190 [Methylothermaceae bacteria B42]HHJ39290.1 hypothetical protein [Methylothermaceae bacterium]
MKMAISSMIWMVLLASISSSVRASDLTCVNKGNEPTPVQIGDKVSCGFEQPNDVDVFVLSVSNESGVQIIVLPPDGSCEGIDYFDPEVEVFDSSNRLIGKDFSLGSASCYLPSLRLFPVAGETYSIVVNSNNKQAQSGDYTVELKCISGDCISGKLVNAQKCSARYDGAHLDIPMVTVGESSYWAKLKLISSAPLTFELSEYGNNK